MNKWQYIDEISDASDKFGNLLIELMEQNNVTNLQQISEEQAKAFYQERIKKMNKFVAMGRLTGDPEIRYSQDSKAVARFNFAVDRRFKREGEADADFFQCVAFGKTAETLEKCSVSKGTKLLLDAEVRNNNYTNKEGQKVYGTQVVVNSFEFCESKGTQTESHSDGFMSIPDGVDEELPFV